MSSSTSPVPAVVYPNRAAMREPLPKDPATTPAECTVCLGDIPDDAPRVTHLGAKGSDITHPDCFKTWIRTAQKSQSVCSGCTQAIDASHLLSTAERIALTYNQRLGLGREVLRNLEDILLKTLPYTIIPLAYGLEIPGWMSLASNTLVTVIIRSVRAGAPVVNIRWCNGNDGTCHTITPIHIVFSIGVFAYLPMLYRATVNAYHDRHLFPPLRTSLTSLWNAGKTWFQLGIDREALQAERHAQ